MCIRDSPCRKTDLFRFYRRAAYKRLQFVLYCYCFLDYLAGAYACFPADRVLVISFANPQAAEKIMQVPGPSAAVQAVFRQAAVFIIRRLLYIKQIYIFIIDLQCNLLYNSLYLFTRGGI